MGIFYNYISYTFNIRAWFLLIILRFNLEDSIIQKTNFLQKLNKWNKLLNNIVNSPLS